MSGNNNIESINNDNNSNYNYNYSFQLNNNTNLNSPNSVTNTNCNNNSNNNNTNKRSRKILSIWQHLYPLAPNFTRWPCPNNECPNKVLYDIPNNSTHYEYKQCNRAFQKHIQRCRHSINNNNNNNSDICSTNKVVSNNITSEMNIINNNNNNNNAVRETKIDKIPALIDLKEWIKAESEELYQRIISLPYFINANLNSQSSQIISERVRVLDG